MKKFGQRMGVMALVLVLIMQIMPAQVLAASKVKNVIVVMADGMGPGHTAITRWYKGGSMALDEIVTGAIRTYGAESLVTDSAPAATAFATGHKSNSKFVGILPAQVTIPGVSPIAEELKYKPVATLLEAAKLAGKSTGLVATANIQHASPAGYSAHTHNRGDYNDIAEQQVYLNIDVVFGGGKQYLLPASQGGKRKDGENLIDVLKARGYSVVETRDEMLKDKRQKVWGLFAMDDMAYEFDRKMFRPSEPTLAEMTKNAIERLAQNKRGFFLFVEASKVDWASHANDPIGVISDILAYDDAVRVALDFARKDGNTMVLCFSDHDNGGMSLGSAKTNSTYDQMPFESLVAPLKKATLTGEGIEKMLAGDKSESKIRGIIAEYYGVDDLTAREVEAIQKAKAGSLNYVLGPIISQRSVIGWTTNGHVGDDVFLYAFGPGAPAGLIDNTDLAKIPAKSMKVDLDDADRKLFVEANKAFAAVGAKVRIDKTDPANMVLVVEKGLVRAELPFSKNIIKVGKKTMEMQGLTVFAAKSGKVYVPQQAVELFKQAAGF